MLFLPLPNPSDLAAEKLTYAQVLPSPVGQPSFGLRLGIAQADRTAYMGGLDVTVPVSAGVRLFALRGDADYWLDGGSGTGRGGDAVSVLGILGPSSSYFGAGVSYASRYGGASGPSGEGLKFVYGSKVLPFIGYELDGIVTTKGSMGAILATVHF